MANFPSIDPTYGQRKKSKPNTRIIRFADGYEHRLLFGLAQHQNPKEYSFTFEVTESQADIIETFLDARANDSDSFDLPVDYLPGEDSTKFKFVCESWSKSIPYKNRATIQATFRQVFEPA